MTANLMACQGTWEQHMKKEDAEKFGEQLAPQAKK